MVTKKAKDLKRDREAQKSIRLRANFSMAMTMMHMKRRNPNKGLKKVLLDRK